jgi:hypothetical protein
MVHDVAVERVALDDVVQGRRLGDRLGRARDGGRRSAFDGRIAGMDVFDAAMRYGPVAVISLALVAAFLIYKLFA